MTLRHGLFVSGAAAGVTPPLEARLALSGLLSGVGLLSGGAVSGSTSGPNMQYILAAGQFVTARGNAATDGLYVFGNDGNLTVSSGTPAPASGTRWDLIWVRHKNAFASDGFGDANSDPDIGVTVGTAGASPTKPYASVPAGALVLAEASVGTNIANASLAVISQVAIAAVARGGIAPVPGSGSYPASPRVGQYVDDATLGLLRWNGTAWQTFGVGGDTGWVNISLLAGYQSAGAGLTPQYRVINGVVYFRGQVMPTSGTFGTGVVTISNLPAAIWPAGTGYAMAQCASSSSAIIARMYVVAGAGTLNVGFSATGASYVDLSALRYPLG